MESNIETLTIRLDAMTVGFSALQALLFAAVRTHPNPQQLSAEFEKYVQAALALHSHTPYGDALQGGIHEVADHFRQEFQRLGTLSATRT